MSNSDKIRRRLNQAELDISRLKADVKNMDNIVSAGGPIDKGFELILDFRKKVKIMSHNPDRVIFVLE